LIVAGECIDESSASTILTTLLLQEPLKKVIIPADISKDFQV